MPIELALPPENKLSKFWIKFFDTADKVIEENFWGNLFILKDAYQNKDSYALQLADAGYNFQEGQEKPASFYSFVNWSLNKLADLVNSQQVSKDDILIPAKAFEVEINNQKTYSFVRIGQEVPNNGKELNLLSPKVFVDMLSAGYFPIGEPIREHTNQALCEHDMAHISGFISCPSYMKVVREAFRRVSTLMDEKPLIKEALENFDSLYSLRLYYMIEVFSIIPENNKSLLEQSLSINISDYSLEKNPEQIYPKVISLLKEKKPDALYQYLYRFYSKFHSIINPIGGESRDILNRTRKFNRSNQSGSFYSTMSNLESKFDGSSIYSMYYNAKAALVNKRSNHPDYIATIENIHAPFIAAMIGTSQLSLEDWVMQAIAPIPDPESKLYKYICASQLWNKSHVLYWAYGFYDPTKVLTNEDFTKENSFFSKEEIKNTLNQISSIKNDFLHQNKSELRNDNKTLVTSLMITQFNKYNAPRVAEVTVTEKAVHNLLLADNKVKGLPRFVADFLNVKPSRHRETMDKRPELYQLLVQDKYLLMPNPAQTDLDMILKEPQKLRKRESGFGLIAWFIHPWLLKNSQYEKRKEIIELAKNNHESLRYGAVETKENLKKLHRIDSFSFFYQRDENQLTNEELVQKSGEPYISGPFDYTKEHLTDLYQLRKDILMHLKDIYGVTEEDKIDIYFHTHYSIDNNTAHLHIRINQLHHGLEMDKSISLDNVLQCLEQNKPVQNIILERRYLHTELKQLGFLRNLGYEVHEVKNPYYVAMQETDNTRNYTLLN